MKKLLTILFFFSFVTCFSQQGNFEYLQSFRRFTLAGYSVKGISNDTTWATSFMNGVYGSPDSLVTQYALRGQLKNLAHDSAFINQFITNITNLVDSSQYYFDDNDFIVINRFVQLRPKPPIILQGDTTYLDDRDFVGAGTVDQPIRTVPFTVVQGGTESYYDHDAKILHIADFPTGGGSGPTYIFNDQDFLVIDNYVSIKWQNSPPPVIVQGDTTYLDDRDFVNPGTIDNPIRTIPFTVVIGDTPSYNHDTKILTIPLGVDSSLLVGIINNYISDTTFINNVINNILNDTTFIYNISNDTTLISNIVNNILNDTTFIYNISHDTTIINNVTQNIVNDTTLIQNIVNNLFSDTTFINNIQNIVNNYAGDTTFINTVINNISNDTTLIQNITNNLFSDTTFINNIQNVVNNYAGDTTFIQNIINNISNDTTLITNITNNLYSDTTFITNVTNIIYNDTTFIYNISHDTTLINNITQNIYNDTTFITNVTNNILNDTTFIYNISHDTTIINNIVNNISNDTTLIQNIVNNISNDTTFITNITNNILNDTTFVTNVTNIISNDTTLITQIINNISNDTTFITNVANYISSDTTIINNLPGKRFGQPNEDTAADVNRRFAMPNNTFTYVLDNTGPLFTAPNRFTFGQGQFEVALKNGTQNTSLSLTGSAFSHVYSNTATGVSVYDLFAGDIATRGAQNLHGNAYFSMGATDPNRSPLIQVRMRNFAFGDVDRNTQSFSREAEGNFTIPLTVEGVKADSTGAIVLPDSLFSGGGGTNNNTITINGLTQNISDNPVFTTPDSATVVNIINSNKLRFGIEDNISDVDRNTDMGGKIFHVFNNQEVWFEGALPGLSDYATIDMVMIPQNSYIFSSVDDGNGHGSAVQITPRNVYINGGNNTGFNISDTAGIKILQADGREQTFAHAGTIPGTGTPTYIAISVNGIFADEFGNINTSGGGGGGGGGGVTMSEVNAAIAANAVPNTATITINGITQTISSNPVFNIDTATATAMRFGYPGEDVTSDVAREMILNDYYLNIRSAAAPSGPSTFVSNFTQGNNFFNFRSYSTQNINGLYVTPSYVRMDAAGILGDGLVHTSATVEENRFYYNQGSATLDFLTKEGQNLYSPLSVSLNAGTPVFADSSGNINLSDLAITKLENTDNGSNQPLIEAEPTRIILANTASLSATLHLVIKRLPEYASNAAAVAAGEQEGTVYRNGDDLKVVH